MNQEPAAARRCGRRTQVWTDAIGCRSTILVRERTPCKIVAGRTCTGQNPLVSNTCSQRRVVKVYNSTNAFGKAPCAPAHITRLMSAQQSCSRISFPGRPCSTPVDVLRQPLRKLARIRQAQLTTYTWCITLVHHRQAELGMMCTATPSGLRTLRVSASNSSRASTCSKTFDENTTSNCPSGNGRCRPSYSCTGKRRTIPVAEPGTAGYLASPRCRRTCQVTAPTADLQDLFARFHPFAHHIEFRMA